MRRDDLIAVGLLTTIGHDLLQIAPDDTENCLATVSRHAGRQPRDSHATASEQIRLANGNDLASESAPIVRPREEKRREEKDKSVNQPAEAGDSLPLSDPKINGDMDGSTSPTGQLLTTTPPDLRDLIWDAVKAHDGIEMGHASKIMGAAFRAMKTDDWITESDAIDTAGRVAEVAARGQPPENVYAYFLEIARKVHLESTGAQAESEHRGNLEGSPSLVKILEAAGRVG